MSVKLLLAPLLLIILNCEAQTKKEDVFDKVIDSLMTLRVPGLTVLIARDGKILKEGAAGFSDIGNQVRSKSTTRYEIASLSSRLPPRPL